MDIEEFINCFKAKVLREPLRHSLAAQLADEGGGMTHRQCLSALNERLNSRILELIEQFHSKFGPGEPEPGDV